MGERAYKMLGKIFHWCPYGCGKRVLWKNQYKSSGYYCSICGKLIAINKMELEKIE